MASQQLPYPMQPQGMPLPYTLPRTGPYPGYMPPMPTVYNPYATLPYPQQSMIYTLLSIQVCHSVLTICHKKKIVNT